MLPRLATDFNLGARIQVCRFKKASLMESRRLCGMLASQFAEQLAAVSGAESVGGAALITMAALF